ncbi:MAG: T9SS type A sorting domain-containing protein, partial [Ekhidna sp.]
NDTVRQQYLLHDYYAFDDGTAEYAAGTNILNGQIAVKFWLEEQDTLTHVAFHFPNVAPSADGKPLTLNIFEALNDSSLALRSQQINVKSDSIINGFTYYELSRPLVLSDTFYISYQQSTNDYIGIGFDRSNMEASQYIFENKGDGWVRNTSIEGALMIRPVFKPVKDFTLGERIKLEKLTIYPNPTKGMISINGHYLYIELRDISGKIIISEKNKEKHNFSNLKAGLYLLRVHQLDGERTYKIIKK